MMTAFSILCAIARDNADLPLAVGPPMTTMVCMEFVLTLIARPSSLKAASIDTAHTLLKAKGARTGEIFWLSDAEAADLPFENAHPAEIVKSLEAALADQKIDVVA